MKMPQTVLVCLCLLGATQLAKSQVKQSAAHTIPGFLDPATGKFTTRIAPNVHKNDAAATGTSIFFREDFQISISNYDQPGTTAVCEVSMSSYGDTIGVYYSEDESVAATAVGGGFTCDVPILTLWTLQTPTTDGIDAYVSVTIYTPGQTSPTTLAPTVYRSSTQSLPSLTQPTNGQTVVQTINFQL